MAIFNIHIAQDNGKVWKVGKPRNIHGPDFYGGIQIFIGFTNEFIDDFVLVDKDRYRQCQKGNTHCQQKIKENPLESEQSGNSLTKITGKCQTILCGRQEIIGWNRQIENYEDQIGL